VYQASGESWTHTFTAVGTYWVDWYVKDPGKKAFDENDPTCKDSGGGTWDKCGSVSVKVIKGRWNPTPSEFTLNITEPDSGDYCTAGETLACSAEAADTDTYIKCGETTGKEEADNIGDWKWTISPASKGSITGNGSSATYTAPADVTEGEQVTITASAKDEAKMDADDGGSRKDGRKSDSVTIKLTKKVKVWTTPSDIDPKVTSPGSGSEAGPDQKFVCKASATDSDHWYFEDDPNTGGDSPDEIPDDKYTWTCSKGSFVGGDNEGPEVVWQAPPADQITDNPNGETVTFTVTVDDKPLPPPPEDNYNKGSRDDGAKSAQGTLTLKKKVKTWTPQTNDSEKLWVSIQSPASGDLVKGGKAITVSADGGDKDHWKYNDNTGEGSEEDSIDYEWSGPGSFSPTTGKSTSWTPPNTPGNATIKVEADDKPLPPPPEDNYNKGSREDGTDEDSVTVKVDADTPVVNITAIDPSYDSGAKKYVPASFRVDVSATDEVGLKSVSCDPPGQTREYSKPGPKSASESFNVTGQTDGDKTITATAKDWVDHEGSAPKDVTVDTTPPESAVNPLPPTVSTTSFVVSWSGQDNPGGVGLKSYDVQVRDGLGAWTDWISDTQNTSATFTGEWEHTYYFQCRARDWLDNLEVYPGGGGDAWTTVSLGFTFGEIKPKEVSFSGAGNYPITADDGSVTYGAPHWQDNSNPPDGDANDLGDRWYPVCFVRNTKMRVTVKFVVENPSAFSGTIKIKGDGPGDADIPPTVATLEGNELTITDVESTSPFPDSVGYLNPMLIEWSVSLDNGGSWVGIGATSNPVYVTLGHPVNLAGNPIYHTLVDLGCRNAAGQSDESGTINAIWGEFADRSVMCIDRGIPMTLLADWIHEGERHTTESLLRHCDGSGRAWCELFMDMLGVQGISRSQPYVYMFYESPMSYDPYGILIQYWSFADPGVSGDSFYPYLSIPDDPFVQDPSGLRWKFTQIADGEGIPGQSNSNPLSFVIKWVVVNIDGKYYDPSLGMIYEAHLPGGPSSALRDFETRVAGYNHKIYDYAVDESVVKTDLNGDGDQEDVVDSLVWLHRKRQGEYLLEDLQAD